MDAAKNILGGKIIFVSWAVKLIFSPLQAESGEKNFHR